MRHWHRAVIAVVACAIALAAACGRPTTSQRPEPLSTAAPTSLATSIPSPALARPTATAVPVPLGRQQRALMAGTPQETVAYVIGSGKPGPVVLVLGGVHGDEPGGWLAAERVTDLLPNAGALIVIPRANRQAILAGARTTPELGDLNRLYPGDPSAVGGPMARMAAEIVGLIEQYQVDAVLDLHESWGFYQDRPSRSTAFLGQTISAFPNERGVVLGEAVVAAVNARINDPAEEMAYREYPPRTPAAVATAAPGQAVEEATPIRAGGTASLGLGSRFPNMAVLLVEMAQQLPLERRVALHVEVVEQVLQALGMQ